MVNKPWSKTHNILANIFLCNLETKNPSTKRSGPSTVAGGSQLHQNAGLLSSSEFLPTPTWQFWWVLSVGFHFGSMSTIDSGRFRPSLQTKTSLYLLKLHQGDFTHFREIFRGKSPITVWTFCRWGKSPGKPWHSVGSLQFQGFRLRPPNSGPFPTKHPTLQGILIGVIRE